MQINPIQLMNQNNLITDYRNEKQDIMQFFDYGVSAEDVDMRLNELKQYTFKRESLANVLMELNTHWGAPKSTFDNIERLKRKDSVVVVGGQQAGLLTGPMYTINKIISIIKYAKKQEKRLNVPVIPVFWIAGEDHDFAEINHIYLPKEDTMKKYTTQQYVHEKKPLTEISLDKYKTMDWINKVFSQLHETNYTKDIYEVVQRCIDESTTYIDFFARVILSIFKDEGLVLIDSGNKKVREIESEYFIKIIENQSEISAGVYKAWKELKEINYQIDIDLNPANGHLFYHVNGERILLERTSSGNWVGKNNEVQLTTEEMLLIAREQPGKLSNNVVTRTLMQELMLPTLTFIGGPGEIGYWSAFKPAFHALDLKMPLVVPRLSITYVTPSITKVIEKYSLDLKKVLHKGVKQSKETWLANKVNPQVEETVMEVKERIKLDHKPLRDIANTLQDDVSAMAEKNLSYIFNNIDFLEKKITKTIEERYSKEINEYYNVGQHLHPLGGLQERIWNPIYFINNYGRHFLKETIETELSFSEDHYLVFL